MPLSPKQLRQTYSDLYVVSVIHVEDEDKTYGLLDITTRV